jgi:choline dehydrogenase-like flavoprotein
MKGGFFDASTHGIDAGEADFVVVGSGAGGGAAARALAGRGASVVVLEEGPLVATDTFVRTARESMENLFRRQGKQTAFGRATIPILQACCVGGSTLVNSAIVWRIPDQVLSSWHTLFGLDQAWAREPLERAYQRIEDEMSARAVTEEKTAGVQDFKMRAGALRAGLGGRFLHRYERDCRGSGRCFHGCPYDAKQSTAVNYLRRAAESGAAIYARAKVDRVVFSGRRAVGVAGSTAGGGRPFRVAARRAVIVAASAIQSPNLLRRSGVRHAALGRHFMAHPGASLLAFYSDRISAWTGAAQGYEVTSLRDTEGVKFESLNVPPEVTASRLPGAGRRLASYLERLDHCATFAVVVRAEAEGTVRPSRLFGDHVRYDPLAKDLDRMRRGLKRVAEIHFGAGATEVVTGVHGMPEVLHSMDEIGAFDEAPLDARAYTLLTTHLFGGCRAGIDPARSVVDPALKVHGFDGLYVMDASVFPTNTGVNPQHGIMAVVTAAAERLVDAVSD